MVDLTLINAALPIAGSDLITSLSDSSPAAKIASNFYEELVKAELSNHPWKRATKIAQLDRLDPDEEGDPPEPWTAAYQLPDDLIEVRTVMVAGMVINYAIHGDTVLCDAASDDEVILHYVWRPPESTFPPWFRMGIIMRMEAIFLRGIGERHREAAARDEAADAQFARARNRDSQSQTARNPVRSTTLDARRGVVPSGTSGRSWIDVFGS